VRAFQRLRRTPIPAQVPRGSWCGWQTVLAQRRLVRVAGDATEAFTRAYEGALREASARWIDVTCPACGAEGFAPLLPSNLDAAPVLGLTCETCGEEFEVDDDGSTSVPGSGRARGAAEAIAAFTRRHGDAVQATLVAEGAAMRAFRESYNRCTPVPGVPAGMRARIRQWRR
jgi:hypothetical protein